MHPIMQYLLIGLTFNGLNPKKQNSFFKLLMCLNFTSVFSVFILNLLELLLNWTGIETIGNAHLISSTLILAAKFFYLIIYKSKLTCLIDTVNRFWKYDKFDEISEKRVSKILDRTMVAIKLFALSVIGTAISFIVFGIPNRAIIFPGYDICDLKTSPCYELHMGWQIYMCFFELFPVVVGFDGLFVCFIGYAYCDIEMIKVALKQMTLIVRNNHLAPHLREETPAQKLEIQNNVREIVDEHSQVMQFIKELNIFYSPMMLLHSMSSLFSLVFGLYIITLDGIPPKPEVVGKYGILLVTVCFQFFIFCYSGSIILEQSKTLEYHFYDIDWWYKTQPELRRATMLMIQRAQHTPKLKIGNMNDLNLESYLAVIRNGVSAFTLIRTMSSSDKLNNGNII